MFNQNAPGQGGSSRNSQGNDDVYENNNSRNQAYDLTDFEQVPLSQIEGLAISKNPDWYQIQVSPGATSLSVDLEFTHADGNIDLSLYNAQGNNIASSTSQTDNESITLDSPEPGVYYIKVNAVGPRGNTYDLVWDDAPAEFRSIDGSENNLANPEWGTPESQLIRLSPAAYNDGISEPRGGDPSSLRKKDGRRESLHLLSGG